MAAHIRFNDDIEHYDPSDSETEYTEKEKDLLKKVRTKRPTHSDSEEEVFGLNQQSSDDSDIAVSDIEGQEDDDLPDVRAWGKNKRSFYSTDYVDPDYGGYQGKDAVSADLEEEEARNIQKRLAEQLDDNDFTLDIFNKKTEKELTDKDEEVIKSDLSSLSKRQLLDLLRKESPEFFELLEDYKEKMKVVKEYLAPIMELDKKGFILHCKAIDFVRTHYQLILNYCTNINMYLLLKASRVNLQHHPIIKRLYQYRQLIAQLEPAYIEIIKPQLEIIIEANRVKSDDDIDEIVTKINKKKTKKLKLLQNLDTDKLSKTKQNIEDISPKADVSDNVDIKIKSILKIDKNKEMKNVSFELRGTEKENEKGQRKKENMSSDSDEENSDQENIDETEKVDDDQFEDSKRAITYQMAKNKGLTPHRKKEQRNPRVKHRNQYRKAKIRRKGAVREVRKELSRYGGEISGIKASVTKSIKIK